jgi:FkbM family methyltransferase
MFARVLWLGLLGLTRSEHLPVHVRAVNPISPAMLVPHHHVFFNWSPYTRLNEPSDKVYDFLGVEYDRNVFCNLDYMGQSISHALRVHNCLRGRYDKPDAPLRYTYPLVGEEYFEYVDALLSVLAWDKTHPYTVVELGCGYCHWILASLVAFQKAHSSSNYEYVGVDGGSGQVDKCRSQLKLNGIDATKGVIHNAAVTSSGTGTVTFSHTGSFGGSVGGGGDIVVPAKSLTDLIGNKVVDLLDVDIQGAEADIFKNHAELLKRQVKRVHIGTHGTGHAVADANWTAGNEIEMPLKAFFESLGWNVSFFFPRTHPRCQDTDYAPTEFGPVCFADGVMSFVNPALVPTYRSPYMLLESHI